MEKAPAPRSAIGDAMVAEGVITAEQLKRALKVQQLLEEPKQLVDVLVDLGYSNRKALTDAIARRGSHLRLGDMLVEQGIITTEALEMALATQRDRGIRVGQALVEVGALNERTLLLNVAHQHGVPYIEPSMNMIDMDLLRGVSVDFLERNIFVPVSRNEEGRVTIVVGDLERPETTEAIKQLHFDNFTFALGPEDAILQTLKDLKNYAKTREKTGARGHQAAEEDSTVQLVNHLIGSAIDEKASDIHIEPMAHMVRVRYRIDGVLVYKTDLPPDLLPKLVSRIKIMAEVNISEHQRHQGGRINYLHGDKEIDLRLSVYVTVHGESCVLRILNKEMALVTLDQLGMTPTMLERFRDDVLDLPTGVVLITGPTGSGKTTTLYSSIDYCNEVGRKIITAEDPVEFTIEGIVQCSMNEKIGRTFANTLREIVRQDPDVIVLGEIRDKETAQVAIQAALTGHKVYSTFHTEDTIGGLLRLIDMDIETFLISSTVISVIAQRLLRRICEHCSTPYSPMAKEAHAVGLKMEEVREYEFKKGRGCSHCSYTGYRGRIAVYELLVLNEHVKQAILEKRTAHEIRRLSVETTGLVSMREDGIAKVIRGITTFDEVLKHTPRTFGIRPLRQVITLCQ
ncbi:MAG: Flp pilus assembly complex ATPase component TadA [Candidatus Hydrogenedentes bacterium]|nr:Flp pilus assembly complex ATPase component TadA [Candidatus Hydrogenedentota bacterium]